jgi:hypothetical protein
MATDKEAFVNEFLDHRFTNFLERLELEARFIFL